MTENKGDLISRSEVVKTLENIEIGKFNRVNVIETIKSISTEQRPQGEWLHLSQGDECNQCHYNTGKYVLGSNFCPNCGADMRGKEE